MYMGIIRGLFEKLDTLSKFDDVYDSIRELVDRLSKVQKSLASYAGQIKTIRLQLEEVSVRIDTIEIQAEGFQLIVDAAAEEIASEEIEPEE